MLDDLEDVVTFIGIVVMVVLAVTWCVMVLVE